MSYPSFHCILRNAHKEIDIFMIDCYILAVLCVLTLIKVNNIILSACIDYLHSISYSFLLNAYIIMFFCCNLLAAQVTSMLEVEILKLMSHL